MISLWRMRGVLRGSKNEDAFITADALAERGTGREGFRFDMIRFGKQRYEVPSIGTSRTKRERRMDERTATDAATSYDFRVGDWLVAPRGNRLVGPEGAVRLEPKVMQVLTCLAAQPGRTVTKDEFMERVWSDTVVSDDVLARCISELRKVFGDSPRNPDYIETIRK